MQYITQDNYLCIEGVVIKEGRPAGSAEAKAKVADRRPTLLLNTPA